MSSSSTRPIHVLHVDDDPTFVELTTTYLEHEDERIEMETAMSASEGLKCLSEGILTDESTSKIDCIVSDYNMPGMDGLKFLETIRDKHPDLPFILFTGKGSEEIASEAISTGVTDYLYKSSGTDQYTLLANRIDNAVAQYRTEHELQEYERDRERYLAAIETIDDAIYALDTEGRFEFVDDQFCELTGYSRSELLGNRVDRIKDEETVQMFEERLGRMLSSDVSDTIVEFELLTKAGTRIPCEDRLSIRLIDEEYQGVAGVIRDISERQTHETPQRRLYEITSNTELSIDETVEQALDLGCEYLSMESGFVTRIENGTQHIVRSSSPHKALQPGNECPLSDSYCRKTIEMDELLTIEHAGASGWEGDPAYDRFGLEAYVGARITVAGDRYGTVCFADRSPRETGITDVERSFINLVVRGIESTLERHKYELELEHQNRQLEKFAGVLSHDLRNPLAVANGYLELAQDTGEDEYFTKIGDAHNRMKSIIDDVLMLARQGESIGETRPVNLTIVAENAWENVETKDRELIIVGEPGELNADEGRLKQLFENLFRNAIDHAGEATRVYMGRCPGGFYIKDDGPGIPESEQNKVFDSGYTTTEEGTGLGLSIVETIATAHGWRIRVEESSDGGARFEIGTTGRTSK